MILDSEVLLIDTNTGKPLPFGTLGVHKVLAQGHMCGNEDVCAWTWTGACYCFEWRDLSLTEGWAASLFLNYFCI